MKRYVRCSESYNYDVSVYAKNRRSGAIDVWSLEATSADSAKSFGYDVLAGLSIDDLFEGEKREFEDFIDEMTSDSNLDADQAMGYDVAEKYFTVKAKRS